MLFSVACFLAALIVGVPWIIGKIWKNSDRTINTTKYIYFGYLAFFLILIGIIVPLFRKAWLYLRISKRSPLDGLATILLGIVSCVPLLILSAATLFLLKKKYVDVYKVFHFSIAVSIVLMGSWVRYHGRKDPAARITVFNHTGWPDYFFGSLSMGTAPWTIVAGINLRKETPTFWDKCIAHSIGKIVERYAISIDRKDSQSRASTARKIIQALDSGINVALFPEGGRTPKSKIRQGVLLQEFHEAIFRIAFEKGVLIQPVVFDWPVMLRGKGDDWWGIHPGKIDVTYVPSFDPKDYENPEELKAACWKAMHEVLASSKKVQTFLKQM